MVARRLTTSVERAHGLTAVIANNGGLGTEDGPSKRPVASDGARPAMALRRSLER